MLGISFKSAHEQCVVGSDVKFWADLTRERIQYLHVIYIVSGNRLCMCVCVCVCVCVFLHIERAERQRHIGSA